MNQVARIFFPAVLAAMVVGTAPSGAADDPVATAPIPPPLPAEPLSPATPMMIPATPPPKPTTGAPGPAAAAPRKEPETAAAPKQKTAPQKPEAQKPEAQKQVQKTEPAAGSPRQKPETTAHTARPKRSVSQQAATRKPAHRKPTDEKTAAEEAAVAAAAEAAEREAARQKAAEPGRERYQGARRTRPPASPNSRDWAAAQPPYGNRPYDNGAYANPGPYPPGSVESGPPRYYTEYPRRPTFYGPAYPPSWYNGVPGGVPGRAPGGAPGGPPPEYYPAPWRGSLTPPW